MRDKIDVGRTYQSQTRVEEWMTAEKAGNKGVDVLSTPQLLQLIEDASMQCLAPLMDANEISLGTHIDISHLSATPVGLIVRTEVEITDDAAVCVVAAAAGYPQSPVHGAEIHGIEAADMVPGVTVLHAGTARDDGGILRVAGGRVLGVRAVAPTLTEARRRVYQGLQAISFAGMQLRSDIALSAASGSVRGRTER